jgi:galactose mutarotase-like enzyme
MHSIENEFLQIHIHPKGAELQRLYNKQTNIDHLWSGDATYWGKFSPILFPIVGTLKEDTYYYNDKAYKLPRHGFAREKEFIVKNKTENSISFSLLHNEATLAIYPFPFELIITYSLVENNLSCSYEVKNIGDTEMYFSIGAHPAFAITGNYEDYYLKFNKEEKLVRYKLDDGLISNTTATIELQNNQLPLLHELFYEDAIILKDLKSTQITIANKNNNHGLDFHFHDFPFFGIWAAKNAPFVCLEPWCGIADNTKHNQILQNKEGIQQLMPSKIFSRSWSVASF